MVGGRARQGCCLPASAPGGGRSLGPCAPVGHARARRPLHVHAGRSVDALARQRRAEMRRALQVSLAGPGGHLPGSWRPGAVMWGCAAGRRAPGAARRLRAHCPPPPLVAHSGPGFTGPLLPPPPPPVVAHSALGLCGAQEGGRFLLHGGVPCTQRSGSTTATASPRSNTSAPAAPCPQQPQQQQQGPRPVLVWWSEGSLHLAALPATPQALAALRKGQLPPGCRAGGRRTGSRAACGGGTAQGCMRWWHSVARRRRGCHGEEVAWAPWALSICR